MSHPNVITLDLNFQGSPGIIASYLVPHTHGAVLVESGPGSTLTALKAGLHAHGYSLHDVTDVLLTHIHLDHAGAAGALARQGARIHVHPNGAAHLLNPEKLLHSAARIYGDRMQLLWGEFLPVTEERLSIIGDGETFTAGSLCFRAIDTPGHANHHLVYLLDDLCFSGDVAGVRLGTTGYIRIPTPPPEFHLENWRLSLERIRKEQIRVIAPTHFGLFDDPQDHLERANRALDRLEEWINRTMPSDPAIETLRPALERWETAQAQLSGVTEPILESYELASPTGMSADGIYRYWHKVRMGPNE